MGFEFVQGWMNDKKESKDMSGYGLKDGSGKGVGRKGAGRRNRNVGGCSEGGEGGGRGGGKGKGKYRLA